MTRYAYDGERGLLLATWSTGSGDAASVVAEVPSAPDRGTAVFRLAERLSGLSRALWRTYTHPASAAPSLDANTTAVTALRTWFSPAPSPAASGLRRRRRGTGRAGGDRCSSKGSHAGRSDGTRALLAVRS